MKTKVGVSVSKIGVAVLGLCILGTQLANAATPSPIVEVVGKLDPKFSVSVNAEDMKRIADELAGVQRPNPIQININELADPKDESAIDGARKVIAEILLNTVRDIVDLKALLYRFSALKQVPGMQASQSELKKQYQNRFQQVYLGMIHRLLTGDARFLQAVNSCYSELCVGTIQLAFQELTGLGEILNKGIPFSESGRSVELSFKSDFLKKITEELYESVDRLGETQPTYAGLIRVALVPLVTASRGVADLKTSFAMIYGGIVGHRAPKLDLTAKKVEVSAEAARNVLSDSVQARIQAILLGTAQTEDQPLNEFILNCLQNVGGRTFFWMDRNYVLRFVRHGTLLKVVPGWGPDKGREIPVILQDGKIFFRWRERGESDYVMLERWTGAFSGGGVNWRGYWPVDFDEVTRKFSTSRVGDKYPVSVYRVGD